MELSSLTSLCRISRFVLNEANKLVDRQVRIKYIWRGDPRHRSPPRWRSATASGFGFAQPHFYDDIRAQVVFTSLRFRWPEMCTRTPFPF